MWTWDLLLFPLRLTINRTLLLHGLLSTSCGGVYVNFRAPTRSRRYSPLGLCPQACLCPAQSPPPSCSVGLWCLMRVLDAEVAPSNVSSLKGWSKQRGRISHWAPCTWPRSSRAANHTLCMFLESHTGSSGKGLCLPSLCVQNGLARGHLSTVFRPQLLSCTEWAS
jgi:hypothetical protein